MTEQYKLINTNQENLSNNERLVKCLTKTSGSDVANCGIFGVGSTGAANSH